MKWASDGGTLHLYELADDAAALRTGVEQATRAASELGVTLLYAECYTGDAAIPVLRGCGFEADDAESAVVKGQLTERLTFVKVLPG